MAGIYLHIPFCKQACTYCDFHFSTSVKYRGEMVNALESELSLRSNYLDSAEVQTIYFGGGTPSLLSIAELDQLLSRIYALHPVSDSVEITLEANPDDLTPQRLQDWKAAGINRFSIGIQSFSDEDLQLMNRAHNAREALSCIDDVRKAGFDNFSIDLIYGLANETATSWRKNLDRAFSFQPPHISAYGLTVEPKTVLAHQVNSGQITLPDDEAATARFGELMEATAIHGYEHYEISNFAHKGFHSCHNSSYWKGLPYLGIGPSAHSFNGSNREWNVANNARYLKALREGKRDFEKESLDVITRYNEYVLIGLRTIWGIDFHRIEEEFGKEFREKCLLAAQVYIRSGDLLHIQNQLTLSRKGKFLADRIAADLFLLEEDLTKRDSTD